MLENADGSVWGILRLTNGTPNGGQGRTVTRLRGLFGCVADLLPFAPTRLRLKQGARWQQLYSPLDGRSANVTVLALPPLGWLLKAVGFGNQYCWCDI